MSKGKRFEMTVIGAGSAMPAHNHLSATQIIRCGKGLYQIDCCDGCFSREVEMGIAYQNIKALFISHIHGDHTNGLLEWLEGMNLGGRTRSLTIYTPDGLERLYKPLLDEFCSDFKYDYEFKTIDTEKQQSIFQDNNLTVETIPLKHSIPCCGFLFKEHKNLPNIIIEKINEYDIPLKMINFIKSGNDYILEDGSVIPYTELTVPADEPCSYAYCSDTAYFPELVDMIKNVTMIFHEASFLSKDYDLAEKFGHSTAYRAGMIALGAHVDKMLIGHISARYQDEYELVNEARQLFKNTELALDCQTYVIERENE